MRWVRRGLWIAAWGAWAWLGWGLYRELPRDLGPIVCRLPLSTGEEFWGFYGEQQNAVTAKLHGDDEPVTLRVWDHRGDLIREIEGPIRVTAARWKYRCFEEHSLLLAQRRPPIKGRPEPNGPSVLNLNEGTWKDLLIDGDSCRSVPPSRPWPPTKPWAAFYEYARQNTPSRVRVIDLQTGQQIFSRSAEDPKGDGFVPYAAHFVGDHLMVAASRLSSAGDSVDKRLELWSIPDGVLLKQLPGIPFDRNEPTSSPSGRIAWHVDCDSNDGVDVFDLHSGKCVFSYPAERRLQSQMSGRDFKPILSDDGRTIWERRYKRLFEVDTGRELWALPPEGYWGPIWKSEHVVPFFGNGVFSVYEGLCIPGWGRGNGELATVAVRSFATGELCYRYRLKSFVDGLHFSTNGDLVHTEESHAIHRMPPSPNYLLLAVCQAILSLPLVFLWAALLWRRKRRERRLAGATA